MVISLNTSARHRQRLTVLRPARAGVYNGAPVLAQRKFQEHWPRRLKIGLDAALQPIHRGRQDSGGGAAKQYGPPTGDLVFQCASTASKKVNVAGMLTNLRSQAHPHELFERPSITASAATQKPARAIRHTCAISLSSGSCRPPNCASDRQYARLRRRLRTRKHGIVQRTDYCCSSTAGAAGAYPCLMSQAASSLGWGIRMPASITLVPGVSISDTRISCRSVAGHSRCQS